MKEIQVLDDYGLVRLVDSMGSDLSIVRAARVSYAADWRAGENEGSDHKLIRYLWRNNHTTPFESVTMTFEVKAPIFVLRQWHRHRTWSFNELSARYRELPEEFYVPASDKLGAQATANKQGRTADSVEDPEWCRRAMYASNECCFRTYDALLEAGVARELARSVLPVATYSHMFATVNLLNLMRFLTLRDDDHAQYEIRVYAEAMRDLARTFVPVAIAAWEDFR